MKTVPRGWTSTTLGEIGRYLNGRAFKQSDWAETGRPIIRIQNLTGSSDRFNYFQGDVDDRYVARPGDLLVSWAATLGSYLWPGPEAVVNQHIFKVESTIDRRFHKYLLDHKLAELMTHTHGSGMVHITRSRFDAIRVAIPPEHEQRRVVDLLEDHLSRLDAASRLATSAATRLRGLRQSRWDQVFVDVPGALRPLLDVVSIANGQTPKGLAEKLHPDPAEGRVPYFKVGDMNQADGRWMAEARFFVSLEDSAALGLHVRPRGTVLIPKRGGAIATNKKRILGADAAIDLNTMGLLPSADLDSSYLWHWLHGIDLGRLADGSNVPQINAPQMRRLEVPVPPMQEQRSIATALDEFDESLTRLRSETHRLNDRLAGLRHAILAAAFSGRLTGAPDA